MPVSKPVQRLSVSPLPGCKAGTMPKLINPRDIALILIVVVATHWLMQPVYKAIDNATTN